MAANIVTVDFSQADAALEIMPERSLLASQGLGWQGIHVQHLHQPPTWETPEFSNAQHVIAVHHFEEPVRLERTLDGKVERAYLTTGDIVITPANTSIAGRWDKAGEVTLLTLEPAYFAQIALEAVDSDCVKLEPQFALKDPLIASIGRSLKAELTARQQRHRLYIDSLTTALAAHLIQHYCTVKQPIRDEARGLPAYQLQRAIDYMHAYLDRNIQLADIATALGMSQYYFARSFQQATGISPYQYLLQCRIEKAKQLLKQPDLAIADIALQCGFNSQSHLHQHFRKAIGMTPKAYQDD